MAIFVCTYCDHKFTNETYYNKHYCETHKRHDYLKTSRGISTFTYYKEWLRLSKGNVAVDETTFIGSKYFTSFMKFVEFSHKMMIPSVPSFIKFAVSKHILPTKWCSDTVFVDYISNLDNNYLPMEQAEETVKTVYELAGIFDCKPNQIFNHLEAGDCIKLLKARKLTPWVLLFSKTFHQYLSVNLSKEQRIQIQTSIDPNIWKYKFQSRPEDVKMMKKMVNSLGL